MQLAYVTDEARWDRITATLPLQHVLQSWAWGDFKFRWGWTPTRLVWREEQPVAAAQLLRRAIPFTPFGIAYVSKGPLLDPTDHALVSQVLKDLEAVCRQQRCLFVKIDPDVQAANCEFVDLLVERGWQRGEPIQFPNTGTLDLRPDEETLLAGMKSKTRYNIRLAGRRGVEVRLEGPDAFQRFYQMYEETARRDGFLIRPQAYYLDLWNDFYRQGLAQLFLAWVENEAVAGLMLFRFGDRAWYLYGASTERHRKTMPNYALQWEAIRWAKEQGVTLYDLWGAPDDPDDPDDAMAGVWRFKRGFNATFRHQIGAWDFPASPAGYRFYTGALPRLRELVRRRSA